MTFLPENYEAPAQGGNYCKFKKGTTTIRIMSQSVVGRLDRKDKKPVRTRERVPAFDNEKQPKHFWSFVVWNYDEEKIQICEITQSGIQKRIMELYKDEDWGDPKGYDLKITKEGDGMDTKYSVTPRQPKEIDPKIMEEFLSLDIDLEALFIGIDPFAPKQQKPATVDDIPR